MIVNNIVNKVIYRLLNIQTFIYPICINNHRTFNLTY